MDFRWRIGFGQDLGHTVKELILALGLDQQEVARAIDYDGGNLSKILGGTGSLKGQAYLSLYRYLSGKYEAKPVKTGIIDPAFMRDYIPPILLKK